MVTIGGAFSKFPDTIVNCQFWTNNALKGESVGTIPSTASVRCPVIQFNVTGNSVHFPPNRRQFSNPELSIPYPIDYIISENIPVNVTVQVYRSSALDTNSTLCYSYQGLPQDQWTSNQ